MRQLYKGAYTYGNKCTKIKRENIRRHFSNIIAKGFQNSKTFWRSVKPFLNDKGTHGQEEYILEENNKLIQDDKEIAEIFNEYYTNILKYTTGSDPETVPLENSADSIEAISEYYKHHPSIMAIKQNDIQKTFELPDASEEEIREIIMNLDGKKAAGIDLISAKLLKLSVNIITIPLCGAINSSILSADFPSELKIGKISPVYKNDKKSSRLLKKFYRPISVLTAFSKIFEKYILSKLSHSFLNNILSNKISAYRKGYSSQHVLLKLTEEWRKMLDQNKVVGVVIMDLSKAFDCLPHELLIAKLASYGIKRNTLLLLYSYLKDRKQVVDIKGKQSSFTTVLAGVPQGSILGPVLFNIFINDMIDIFETCSVNNFADDNGISTSAESVPVVITNLETDSFKAINWFKENKMIANPGKFDAMIMKKHGEDISKTILNIGDKKIETSNKIELLGLTIDDKLSFKEHIAITC